MKTKAAQDNSLLLYKRPYAGVGHAPETPEFIIRVNDTQFKGWKKNPGSVGLVEVVGAWDVFVSKTKHHNGALERPSHHDLQEVFGTTNFEDIFRFMAEHGHLQSAGHGLEGHQQGIVAAK